jgi:3-mercaptopropionate dioxygenase
LNNLMRFRSFTHAMTQLVSVSGISEKTILDGGTRLLEQLLANDDWLPDELSASSPAGYRQYLLHCDPLERFCVMSFVWEPGQATPVHDHLTWGLVGQLRGEELCEEYAPTQDRCFARTSSHRMRCGQVDRVSPTVGDVHAVSNASREVAVSIHVYGANIGAAQRHVFDPATGTSRAFVSGYHNAWIPNLWMPSTTA